MEERIKIKNVFHFSTFKLAVIFAGNLFSAFLLCICTVDARSFVLFIIQRRRNAKKKKLYSLINVQLICMMATESISLIFWPRVQLFFLFSLMILLFFFFFFFENKMTMNEKLFALWILSCT